MRAVINFGHGPMNKGYDPGAIGATGLQEATETREVGARVVQKLQANDWEVLAIQDGDLEDITDQANSFKPDVFLSIHTNSAVPAAHGIETYALAPGGMGEKIAREIQKELVTTTGLTDRGVKFAEYWVLRKTLGYPAVLTEIAFISNPAEEALMEQDSWDDKVASAICRGFSRALGVPYVEWKGERDVLSHAIVYFSDRDFSSARIVSDKFGGCAMFCRNGSATIHADARSAKHLVVIGGPECTDHANVTNCCGIRAEDTAISAAEYAKKL